MDDLLQCCHPYLPPDGIDEMGLILNLLRREGIFIAESGVYVGLSKRIYISYRLYADVEWKQGTDTLDFGLLASCRNRLIATGDLHRRQDFLHDTMKKFDFAYDFDSMGYLRKLKNREFLIHLSFTYSTPPMGL